MPTRQGILDRTSLVRGAGSGRPGTQQTRALTARGTVAIAPTGPTDGMVVLVKGVDRSQGVTVPPGHWEPRRDVELPVQGNDCLVVYDDPGDAWVPVWSPY